MKNSWIIGSRNYLEGSVYKHILKPYFFRKDPEEVHDRIIKLGSSVSKHNSLKLLTSLAFNYRNTALAQNVDGVEYQNPIGLAAGFDKNASLTGFLPHVGFGYEEIGSVTGRACSGNKKPRLWRLVESEGLVVYYGLMNNGAKSIANALSKENFKIPIGVSIAKTNSPKTATTEAGVKDYVNAYKYMSNIGDYVTINISCPNAFGGQPFTDKKSLGLLLERLQEFKVDKPHYIKLSPDLSKKQINEIIELAEKYKLSGFVTSNLTKQRGLGSIKEKNLPETGGLSGKVVSDLSLKQLKYLRKQTGDKFTLISCGGIFTAEDAYKRILNGASLLQLITGMIYLGPQQISEINRGLVKLLKNDRFKNISEAVGQAN